MITDVEHEYAIVRTAQRIVNLGATGVKQHIKDTQEKSLVRGDHPNAYMQMSESDFCSAQILVDAGLGDGDSVLKRMGMWRIGKFTYFTKSGKWNTLGSKTYTSKSLQHFINVIINRND